MSVCVQTNMYDDACDITRTYVHDVYNKIASHFDETRRTQWSGPKEFVSSLPKGSVVLDIGCGNGRYGDAPSIAYVGVDACIPIMQIAKDKRPSALFAAANGLNLPFRDGAFDAVMSVAVLHHLPDVRSRRRFVAEAVRVVRPGGKVFMTVWANSANQDRRKARWTEGKEPGDYFVPWNNKNTGEVHIRYYHLFEKEELESLLASILPARTASTIRYKYELDNWMVEIDLRERHTATIKVF